MDKIQFILPDSESIRKLNQFILQLYRLENNLFNENIEFVGAYGMLHDCILSGGRQFGDKSLPIEAIEEVITLYKNFGLTYRFTFTNSIASDNDLLDKWSNTQLKLCEKHGCGVIVNSDKVLEYIKQNYDIKEIILSTTSLLSAEDTINALNDDRYSIVVLNTQLNKQLPNIIPKTLRSKCETLINDCCHPFCKNRATCYINILKCKNGEFISNPRCMNPNRPHGNNWFQNEKLISEFTEELTFDKVKQLHKAGFNLFKLEGRYKKVQEVLYHYMRFFIKPECQVEFLYKAFNFIFINNLIPTTYN